MKSRKTLSDRIDEYDSVFSSLESLYGPFYALGTISRPRFLASGEGPKGAPETAFVQFNKEGDCVDFCFYEEFWDSLTDDERRFVLVHEMLHVLFDHGIRLKDCKHREIGNIAADVAINEMIVSDYDIPAPRERKKYCFIDTVFKNPNKIDSERSMEYYYQQIEKEATKINMSSFDGHEFLDGLNSPRANQKITNALEGNLSKEEVEGLQKKLQKVANNQKPDEKQQTQAGKQAGTVAVGVDLLVQKMRIVRKRKWETLIKRWTKNAVHQVQCESWVRENPRYRALPKHMALPGTGWEDYMGKNKIKVWLFQDTSGSCVHLLQRFYNAALSIPEDRFEVKLFCFDTRSYPISTEEAKKGVLKGGGGTCFVCIEDQIQKYITQNNEKYPAAVFIVTDGYASQVHPEHPERWHFFLSENYRQCIPPESKVHMLSDFE